MYFCRDCVALPFEENSKAILYVLRYSTVLYSICVLWVCSSLVQYGTHLSLTSSQLQQFLAACFGKESGHIHLSNMHIEIWRHGIALGRDLGYCTL